MLFPYLKEGKTKVITINRPIPLISNLSKLMEKIVHLRLYNLLFERQYGFRNKLSTNHALIDVTSKIQTGCDKGIFACGIC